MKKVIHEIPPFVEEDSTILILGSIPSVKSREAGFYYMHPQNRFWHVLTEVFQDAYPESLEDKKAFLKKHKIALYDVLDSCEIEGSQDSTIQNEIPTSLLPILKKSSIARIYTTGKTAYSLYQKYEEPYLGWKAVSLPSTSSLNASMKMDDLMNAYQVLRKKDLQELVNPLLSWYQKNQRDLPWRKTTDPYAIWISEIMLQQTRVETVKPYYQRFLDCFPTIESLANGREDILLKRWEGLGYYRRAFHLQQAAQVIMKKYHGLFPKSYREVISLPGIGSYTAGAILSIAFSEPYPAVDGNVLRVIYRILGSFQEIGNSLSKQRVEHMIKEVLTKENARNFNQALMELGATICLPKKQAKCHSCPLSKFCKAYQENWVELLPMKKQKKASKIVEKTCLLLECNGNYAILKRPSQGLLGGLYQFPEAQFMTKQSEVVKWCKENQLAPFYIQRLDDHQHVFTHLTWKMNGFYVRVEEENQAFLWVSKEALEQYSIPTAFSYYHPKNLSIS